MHDLDLLRQYSREGSQAAFASLVGQYVDLVYSTARRQVRLPELAEEITQAVFLDLAHHADTLRPESHVASWLYVVTRRTSIDAIRRESRRLKREEAALEGAALMDAPPIWPKIEPLLDEAILSLGELDRKAVLLRFFEGKNFREIGQALGASQEAAQKKVSRAVERLRGFLARRGVTASATALAAEIAQNSVQAAPTGLAKGVSTAIALAQPAIQQGAVFQTVHTLTMTAFRKTIVTTLVAAAVAAGLYQNNVMRRQERELASLEGQTENWKRQVRQLNRGRIDAAHQLDALRKENQRLQDAGAEQASSDSTDVALKSWLIRVSELKQRFDKQPGQKTAALQFATDQDWLDAARANLDTEDDYRRALSKLRNSAANEFAPMLQSALKKYSQANAGQFPTDLSQLQPYLSNGGGSAVLDQYQILPASTVPNWTISGNQIITQKSLVDAKYDATIVVASDVIGSSYGDSLPLVNAFRAYAASANGQMPGDPSQLLPYATTPDQLAAVQKAIQRAIRK